MKTLIKVALLSAIAIVSQNSFSMINNMAKPTVNTIQPQKIDLGAVTKLLGLPQDLSNIISEVAKSPHIFQAVKELWTIWGNMIMVELMVLYPRIADHVFNLGVIVNEGFNDPAILQTKVLRITELLIVIFNEIANRRAQFVDIAKAINNSPHLKAVITEQLGKFGVQQDFVNAVSIKGDIFLNNFETIFNMIMGFVKDNLKKLVPDQKIVDTILPAA